MPRMRHLLPLLALLLLSAAACTERGAGRVSGPYVGAGGGANLR